MTARDHFTRYQPASDAHMPLAAGEVATYGKRTGFGPALAVAASFIGFALTLGAILFGALCALAATGVL